MDGKVNLKQHPELPTEKRPIVIIGSGGIVRHAHLPAYRMCGWDVLGVYDLNPTTAQELARDFGIAKVYGSVAEAAQEDAIFDLATPAAAVAATLRELPDGAFVLIQKPMGEDLTQAEEIRAVCQQKGLRAAVNFQLRYAPYSLAVRDLLDQGLLGDILDIDVKVWVHTPWAIWTFLEKSPRMEVVYHSIHYLDWIRSVLGDPASVKAWTIKHPASPKLHSSRSAVLMDYGPQTRAQVVTYHAHDRGPKHQQSDIRIEGTKGSVVFRMGLNMNYPDGEPDFLEYRLNDSPEWVSVPLEGSWFPHAFRGTMASVMHWADDPTAVPATHYDDAFQTMKLVEAIYLDSEKPGTPV